MTAVNPMPSAESPAPDWLWCEWVDRHPPHLYALDDGDGMTIYACSGEGDE